MMLAMRCLPAFPLTHHPGCAAVLPLLASSSPTAPPVPAPVPVTVLVPQAMAAYRTAHRLFPGLHAPLMGMGQEYQRMNNLGLAEQCFSQVGVCGGRGEQGGVGGGGVGGRVAGGRRVGLPTQGMEWGMGMEAYRLSASGTEGCDDAPLLHPTSPRPPSYPHTPLHAQASKLCPSDPLVANELGVLAYRSKQYDAAAAWLRQALALVPGGRLTPGERAPGCFRLPEASASCHPSPIMTRDAPLASP